MRSERPPISTYEAENRSLADWLILTDFLPIEPVSSFGNRGAPHAVCIRSAEVA